MEDDEYTELFKRLSSGRSTGASWRDIAAELESLGNTFSEVLRRAWQTQNEGSGIAQVRDVFASAIDELNRAVEGTPESERAREQLKEMAESLQQTADRATAELRPQLLSVLRQANAALRRRAGLEDKDYP